MMKCLTDRFHRGSIDMLEGTKEKIEKLQEMVDSAVRIVFFGGAGVSTESGIPDFRSVNHTFSLVFYKKD